MNLKNTSDLEKLPETEKKYVKETPTHSINSRNSRNLPASANASEHVSIVVPEPEVEREPEREPEPEPEQVKDVPRQKYFRKNLRSYVKELSQQIEVHGIRYLLEDGRSVCERLFWMTIIIMSLGGCIILVILVNNFYVTTPVIVTFSTKETPIFKIPFPAVTICSQVKSSSRKYNLLKIHEDLDKNESFIDDEESNFYHYVYMTCDSPIHGENAFTNPELTDISGDDFFESMSKFGPKVDDVMYLCVYMQQIFDCSTLFKRIYTNTGPCFAFNMVHWSTIFQKITNYQSGYFDSFVRGSDWSYDNRFKTQKVATFPMRGFQRGSNNALHVFLKQEKKMIDPLCVNGISGFKVMIHRPLDVPDFDDYFIQIPLNKSAMVSVEPNLMQASEVVRNLPLETRKCFLAKERFLKFFRKYTHANCLNECLTNFTLNTCGCVAYYMPREKSTPVCGSSKVVCLFRTKRLFELTRLKINLDTRRRNKDFIKLCGCKPFCMELRYGIQVSYSDWVDWPNTQKNLFNDSLENYELSHLSVFFKQEYFINLEKMEFYGVADLMANVGGLLNFFVGSSVVTMLEIVYAFTLKIFCNKVIYGPWAGPASVQYQYVKK